MSWISRIANALRPARTAADIDDELQLHFEQRVDDLVRDGMSRREAELLARRRLGNRLLLRESSQEVKSAAWLDSLLRDFRFGLRMLAKHRATSLAAIVSLALAIGACTAAFALIDALIFRPLPLPAPKQLIDIARLMPAFLSPDNRPREGDGFSYAQYELIRDTARDHADIFAMNLSAGFQAAQFDDAGGASENVRAESISGRGFEILGVKPALGRLIQTDDDSLTNGDPVAVLSHAFWKRRFSASPAAIGRWVTVGRKQFQIIGVAAAPFSGVQPGYLTDLWLPLSVAADARILADPEYSFLNIWGRLHPGVEASQVRERLQPAMTNFLRERARINPRRRLFGAQLQQFTDTPVRVRDASTGRNSLFRAQFRRPLWIFALICALLLLIACSNVANLMIARASARGAEMALRISLGAGRSRLIQQMLIESGQLAAAACLLALLLAVFIAPSIVVRLGPTEFPAWLDVAPDYRTLAFAAALSVLTVVLFGVIPAFRASAVSPGVMLKAAGTQHSGRIGSLRWMLAAQVGFSVAVLFLSGLLLLSFRKLITVDLGFARDNVVLFDLAPRHPEVRQHISSAELLEHLRRLPGVQGASLSQQRPMGGDMVWIMTPIIRLPGRANEIIRPREVPVSAGFFAAMQIRWVAGRDFLPEEIANNSSSVIVNQAFVDKFLPGQNPIGQQFAKLSDDPEPTPQQIVGVVANVRYNNLRESEGPQIYTPLRNVSGATLNIRTGSSAASQIPQLRKETEAAAPALTVRSTILLASQIDNTLIRERLLALLSGFFSVVALLLAGVGLYGVINYAAVRRTREIGIRIALGARRAAVVRLIVSDTSIPVAAGIVLGIAGGIGLARYLASQLFGVKPADFWSLAAPLTCILIAAIAAVFPPAFRAAGADPLIALRHE
ncbi:MAG TPA: ABC transporter permease [Bryobacteraceae bacterium]|nr:ABC transporter permease [Bryobacteraceae bacterium]